MSTRDSARAAAGEGLGDGGSARDDGAAASCARCRTARPTPPTLCRRHRVAWPLHTAEAFGLSRCTRRRTPPVHASSARRVSKIPADGHAFVAQARDVAALVRRATFGGVELTKLPASTSNAPTTKTSSSSWNCFRTGVRGVRASSNVWDVWKLLVFAGSRRSQTFQTFAAALAGTGTGRRFRAVSWPLS